ncbi:MAG: S8 family serine peptidase [Candidatus Sericytochromatia bacterium]|nr:S8 family serine peptidase [Candidatus Sericytochromatia bacterium]
MTYRTAQWGRLVFLTACAALALSACHGPLTPVIAGKGTAVSRLPAQARTFPLQSRATSEPASSASEANPATPLAGDLNAADAASPLAKVEAKPTYTGEFLLRVPAGTKPEALMQLPALQHASLTATIPLGDGWVVRVTPPAGVDENQWKSQVLALPQVRGLQAERMNYPRQVVTNDPDTVRQWAHATDTANTVGAWALVPPASQASVVIAVLDTGLDITHDEFAPERIRGTFNGLEEEAGATDTSDVTDDDGHGTHVAGIAAASGGNNIGGAGVAWGAGILPVKVLGPMGGTDTAILLGMIHAMNWRPDPDDGSRVRVMNMSLGAQGEGAASVGPLYTEAVALARLAGVVVVIAAGNGGQPFVESPANTPLAVAVGSTHHHLGLEGVSSFSSGGTRLDLVAPGENIYSTIPGNDYDTFSGTSMAAPYVAGLVALITARYDAQNLRTNATFVDLVRHRLTKSAKDIGPPGRDNLSGWGRVDARRAVATSTIEADP